jgi:integrase
MIARMFYLHNPARCLFQANIVTRQTYANGHRMSVTIGGAGMGAPGALHGVAVAAALPALDLVAKPPAVRGGVQGDRRTAASLARKGGASIEQVQVMLGHSSPQTTSQYIGEGLDLDDHAVDYSDVVFPPGK